MNEQELKRILARNPAIRAEDQGRKTYFWGVSLENSSKVPPPEPQRGTSDALDEVVQGETPSQVRPVIRFVFYRTRLVDADAVHAGAKDLLDGLVEAGIIPGDREDQIDFDAKQKKVHYRKEERTEIEITV